MSSPTPESASSPADAAEGFVLELAPDPSLIVTARLFAAGLARLAGCQEEQVDDVKLAISEACAVVLRGAASSAYVEARRGSDRITFAVGPVRGTASPSGERGESGPEASIGGSLPRGLDLIALVFDDATIDGVNGHDSVLRFSVPVDEPI
jgi:hypothetical protein